MRQFTSNAPERQITMAKDRIEMLEALGFEPNLNPQLRDLRITGQTLKGVDLRFNVQGLTNVEDLGQLTTL
jgi:hypothetical protein